MKEITSNSAQYIANSSNSKDTKKPHNTADTSKNAYALLKSSGQIQRERQKVLEAIRKIQPCTSRMLMDHLRLERGNITRSLYDLVNADNPIVQEAFKGKCKVTNIIVKYYSIIEKEEAKNES